MPIDVSISRVRNSRRRSFLSSVAYCANVDGFVMGTRAIYATPMPTVS